MKDIVTIDDYRNSNISKGFLKEKQQPNLTFESLEKSLNEGFKNGTISEELFEKSLDELDLLKGVASRDLTHGGKLVPKHIIDSRGYKKLVYVLPEEVTGEHSDLTAGDKYKTRYKGIHTLVKDKGHDGKGHLVTLRDDDGRVHDKYLHNIEHVSEQVKKPNEFINFTKSGKKVNEGEDPIKTPDKFKEWSSKDHEDAAEIHQRLADAAKKVANWNWRNGEKDKAKENYKLFDHHNDIGNSHRKIAEKLGQEPIVLPKGVLGYTKTGKIIPESPKRGLAFSLRDGKEWDEQDFQDTIQILTSEANKEEKIAKKLYATGDKNESREHYSNNKSLKNVIEEFQMVVNHWDHRQNLEGTIGEVNGRTLHANPNHHDHDDFSWADHYKAQTIHKDIADNIKDEFGGYTHLNLDQRKKRAAHYRAAEEHKLLSVTIDERQRKKKEEERLASIAKDKRLEQEKQDFLNSPEGKRVERLKKTPGTLEYKQEQKKIEIEKESQKKVGEQIGDYYQRNIAQGRRAD